MGLRLVLAPALAAVGSGAPATKIDPMLQFQLERTRSGDPVSFGFRRSRFQIEEDLGKQRSLVIEVRARPDEVELLDGYIEAGIGAGFEIQVGRFKRPFSRGALISARDLRTTDRDIVYDLFGDNDADFGANAGESGFVGRDEGVSIGWRWRDEERRSVSARLGCMNGVGPKNEDQDSEKQWIARASVRLCDQVELGAGANWARSTALERGRAWAVDGSLRWKGLSLWGEWLAGDNRAAGVEMTGSTVEGSAEWGRFVPGLRVSRIDPDRDLLYDAVWEWTPFVGVTIWKDSVLIAELDQVRPVASPLAESRAITDRIVLAWRWTP